MPFDPTVPANNADLVSAVMRSQLTGLKDLIDAILTITAAQIDSVTTVNPTDPATVSLSVVGNTLHFTFGIPQGNDGAVGPQGPPFAGAIVDSTTTLDPGNAATVGVTFDGSNVRFTFGIPRGADGTNGTNGFNGSDGSQGPPGEVSNAALAAAITGTSNNSNGVATLAGAYADPDSEALRLKMDELIAALRR